MSEKVSVLVVDDNPPMTKTLADILAAKDYKVHAAFSGREALEILEDQEIDILLTDVRMPDMNGVDLYRKSRETHPDMVTFLMTAYAANDIIQAGIMSGIKTVLTKPLDIDMLLILFSASMNAYHRDEN
jgi:DNA-binding NtrC family response regulator